MTARTLMLTFFGNIINGNLQTPPVKPAYENATIQDILGGPVNNVNPQYFATEDAANDLAALLSDYNPTIVAGDPQQFDHDTEQHMIEFPKTARWFKISGFNKFNAPVTVYHNAGMLLSYWSHGEDPDMVLGEVRTDIDGTLKTATATDATDAS